MIDELQRVAQEVLMLSYAHFDELEVLLLFCPGGAVEFDQEVNHVLSCENWHFSSFIFIQHHLLVFLWAYLVYVLILYQLENIVDQLLVVAVKFLIK